MYTFKNDILKISVRNLVEFICRHGDIDNRRGSGVDINAMDAGSKAHRKIQKQMGSEYEAEVPMKMEFDCVSYRIVLEGRADGVITEPDLVTIDEIKGIYKDLKNLSEPVYVHKAQAMCYAYMKCVKDNLGKVGIMMTYVNLDNQEIKHFNEVLTFDELKIWFDNMFNCFKKWTDFLFRAKQIRKETLTSVGFPFEYREGQRDIAVSVYKTIKQQKKLFVQAPTGVGKTMSTVFPSIKAIGEDLGDKLFYLTAKTITRTVASEAFDILRNNGAYFRTAVITAKEKICFNEECTCNPVACPYARGHFDRVNDAVFDIITHEEIIDRSVVEEYAKKHNVCPFEFSLDVTYWVDGIICDYNYVFDPNVYLKRYFSDSCDGEYIFLIDEAHNLVDRAREMYSAVLYKEEFLEAKRLLGDFDKRLSNALVKCNKLMLELKREADSLKVYESIAPFLQALERLEEQFARFFEERRDFEYNANLTELFFKVRHFLNMNENIEDNYVIYSDHTAQGFMMKLFCVNPSKCLKQCLKKGNASVFFSATLLPVNYYKELLSDVNDYAIYICSPFPQKNRALLIGRDVTSKYTRRNENEYLKIKRYINEVYNHNKGNYMVFFPSYNYMEKVYDYFSEKEREDINILVQTIGMDEEKKEEFLNHFLLGEKPCVGFCVIGGVFSEGIDLKNESLIGCIIVGTGLPQICAERQLLRDYHEKLGENGYDYAYVYPGMNKVMQAAGRVIRTMEDKGIILLLDERFTKKDYLRLFPAEWDDYVVTDLENVIKHISTWEQDEKY